MLAARELRIGSKQKSAWTPSRLPVMVCSVAVPSQAPTRLHPRRCGSPKLADDHFSVGTPAIVSSVGAAMSARRSPPFPVATENHDHHCRARAGQHRVPVVSMRAGLGSHRPTRSPEPRSSPAGVEASTDRHPSLVRLVHLESQVSDRACYRSPRRSSRRALVSAQLGTPGGAARSTAAGGTQGRAIYSHGRCLPPPPGEEGSPQAPPSSYRSSSVSRA